MGANRRPPLRPLACTVAACVSQKKRRGIATTGHEAHGQYALHGPRRPCDVVFARVHAHLVRSVSPRHDNRGPLWAPVEVPAGLEALPVTTAEDDDSRGRANLHGPSQK